MVTCDILCVTSDNYRPVFDLFCSSLGCVVGESWDRVRPGHDREMCVELNEPLHARLHVRWLDLSPHRVFGFGTPSWRLAITAKLSFALEFMIRASQDSEVSFVEEVPKKEKREDCDYIIVSDADVQVLRPAGLMELVEEARLSGLDFYGMQEGVSAVKSGDGLRKIYNGGFYVLRNTPDTRAFLQEVLRRISCTKNRYVDQEIINELLTSGFSTGRDGESKHVVLKHAMIDQSRCLWGSGRPRPTTIIHHAVCALTTRQKVAQMHDVRMGVNLTPGNACG